jgi:hypothetical protein
VSIRDLILTPPPLSRHPVDVGLRTEAAIERVLLAMGHRVLRPVGQNQRYDLVLDTGGRFLRCQCKTGRLRNGSIVFSAQSIRSNTKRAICRDYRGEIDCFLVFCAETGGVYAIPMDDALRTTCTLRVDPAGNNQARRIRWAADYRLPTPAELRDAA